MTLGFFLLTVGSMFLYESFKNLTTADLLLGRPSSIQSPDVFGDASASGGGMTAGGKTLKMGSGGDPKNAVTIDGHPVCPKIAAILLKARHDGVHFSVISGIRTVAESVAACQNICGAPSCPGTCAGASSNHNGCSPGAVDIGTGCADLKKWLAAHGNPIFNALPDDQCHFSSTGH